MPPPWLHGTLNKDQSEALLKGADGALPTGRFLVRASATSADEYILTLAYKSMATHHKIRKNEAGIFVINDKNFDSPRSLEALIDTLSKPLTGWPVVLSEPVAASNNTAAAPAAADPPPPPPAAPSSPPPPLPESTAVSAAATGGAATSSSRFFHGFISKNQAEDLLRADLSDGRFLVRQRAADSMDELILGLNFKGQPSHHLMKRDGPGQPYTINGKPTNGATTVDQVIQFLGVKLPFWPVPLLPANGVPCTTTTTSSSSSTGSEAASPPVAPAAAAVVPAEPAAPAAAPPAAPESSRPASRAPSPKPMAAPAASSAADDSLASLPFFHAGGNSVKADELLAGGSDGTFLVREHVVGDPHQFVLSVVYKGKPTHHLIKRDGPGAEFTINNQPTGCSTLPDVIRHLSTKQPKWPVPLTTPAPASAASRTSSVRTPASSRLPSPHAAVASAPSAPSSSSSSSTSTSSSPLDVYHGCISKDAADALLMQGTVADGKYLLRGREGSNDEFILGVIFKNTPTHHLVKRSGPGAVFAINNQSTEDCTTLAQLIAYLGQKRPKWPVPLVTGVPGLPLPDGKETQEKEPEKPSRPPPAAEPAAAPAASSSLSSAVTAEEKAPPPAAPAPAPAAAPAAVTLVDASMTSFFHGDLSEEAANRLLRSNAGDEELVEALTANERAERELEPSTRLDGKFLFRNSSSPGAFVVSLMSGGQPRHFQITRRGPILMLSSQFPTGCSTLAELHVYLQSRQPGWAVPLRLGLPGFPVMTAEQREQHEREARLQAQREDEERRRAQTLAREEDQRKAAERKSLVKKQQEEEARLLAARESEIRAQRRASMHGGAAEEAAETATAAKAVAKKRVSVAAAAKVEAISESDEDSGSDSDESISDSDEELDEADKVDSAASSSASSSQQYHYSGPSLDKILHGALKKDEAEGLLMLTTADQPDGAYMLRCACGRRAMTTPTS